MFESAIKRILQIPHKSQITINFCLKEKVFSLSAPIFSSARSLPNSVKKYVEARKKATFKPHLTSFHLDDKQRVFLRQKIPLSSSFQETLRQQIQQFWQLSQHCHQMLVEIAVEEKYKEALHLNLPQ